MNIVESFASWLEQNSFGTLGSSIFIGVAPLNAVDPIIWLVANGGFNQVKAVTGSKIKSYTISIYYRSTNAQDVYNFIEAIETAINSAGCITLNGYDVVEVETIAYPTDQDLDDEDRTVALVEVTIRTHL